MTVRVLRPIFHVVGVAPLCLLLSLSAPAVLHAGEYEDAVLRGNAFVKTKEYDKAVREYKKAAELKPNDSKINLLLGMTYASMGDAKEARKYTETSLRQAPGYQGYHNMGLIYANEGNYEEAVRSYRKALELNPESYRAWYQLGLVYATDLKFDEAVTCYEKVLQLNPGFTDAYLGLGSAYYWSGDMDKALEQVARLRESKASDKADALEAWIHNTEAKKKK